MAEAVAKPPEVIQAQIAAFATEHVGRSEDSAKIINDIGNLSVGDPGDVRRITESTEYHKEEDGKNSVRVPRGTAVTVATKAEYTNFLRSVGGSGYEGVQGRADMLKAYDHFEPVVTQLRAELADPKTRMQHPNFLGRGAASMVFSVEQDSKKYAVRVPSGEAIQPTVIDSHLAGAVLGRGVPRLEQIVAASYKDGVTVSELIPGKRVGDLTIDDINMVTDEQLGELVDTLIEVSRRGIEIDFKPTNLLYDPMAGYGIVDYWTSKEASKVTQDQQLGWLVGRMSWLVNDMGFPERHPYTIEAYAQRLELKNANVALLRSYREIVETKLSGEHLQVALGIIDDEIDKAKEFINKHSNPQWVNEQIERDEEFRQRREAQSKRLSGDIRMPLEIV